MLLSCKHYVLSHDQNTIHAEKGCADMRFHMFLTGHGMKARTRAHVQITHFPTWCIIRTWTALGVWPHASHAFMMHLVGKCASSARAWILA